MVQLNPVPVFSAKKIPVTFDGNNGKENFGSFRKNRKTVITRKVLLFLENFHLYEPFHLNSPRNFWVFHTNGKC